MRYSLLLCTLFTMACAKLDLPASPTSNTSVFRSWTATTGGPDYNGSLDLRSFDFSNFKPNVPELYTYYVNADPNLPCVLQLEFEGSSTSGIFHWNDINGCYGTDELGSYSTLNGSLHLCWTSTCVDYH